MISNKATISWWKSQDSKIKEEAFGNSKNNPRVDIKQALMDLSKWFKNSKYIWGHGSSFDCSIIEEAYKMCDLKQPWMFWNTRDTRTLYDIANIKTNTLPNNNKHHALYDCYRQIVGVHKSMNVLFEIV